MPVYSAVCREDEIPPGATHLVHLDGREIGLFHVGGEIYAMENTCLHAGGPLHEGTIEGTTVTCAWHQWQFDLRDGSCSLNPCVSLQTYDVRVRGGSVEIAPRR